MTEETEMKVGGDFMKNKQKLKYNWTIIWDYSIFVYYRHFKTELGAFKFLVKILEENPESDWYIIKRKEFEKEKFEMNDIVHYKRG